MAYCRITETGHYIYPTGDGVQFDKVFVSDNAINVFLYALSQRSNELNERIENGKLFIENQNDMFKFINENKGH